ncbi:MAG TPA: DUF4199 domain-containing protein [Steroidobacteraceae bacterium]|jgi:hypothetical protein|nr:DUF4199 domain-containing protein [Steroidobacteraceae bacterium]
MISLILRYGLIAGLIVATPMAWAMLTAKPGEMPLAGMLVSYLIMLVALTAVFLGIKRYRDTTLGGVIRFLPAFGVGLGISAVASIIYVIGWEVSSAFSSFDFVPFYKNLMIESAKAKHPTPAELSQAIADAESFATMYANPWYRLPMTFIEMFPVGVLVSLISAAVLRNSRVLPARATS